MSDLAERYIDLVASGNETKINCVLKAAGAAGFTAGVGAAAATSMMNVVPGPGNLTAGTIIGISAVVGVLLGAKAGLKVCGGGTEGSLDKLLTGQVSAAEMDDWTGALVNRGLKRPQAEALVSAAIIELQRNGMRNIDRNAPFNAGKLQLLGDQIASAVA
jgi:hypothetical protein